MGLMIYDREIKLYRIEGIDVDKDDIRYIEIIDRSVYIHLEYGFATSDLPLHHFQGILGDDFVVCHRGILVNVKKIHKVSKDVLTLYCGTTLPVSRRSKNIVMSTLVDLTKYKSTTE